MIWRRDNSSPSERICSMYYRWSSDSRAKTDPHGKFDEVAMRRKFPGHVPAEMLSCVGLASCTGGVKLSQFISLCATPPHSQSVLICDGKNAELLRLIWLVHDGFPHLKEFLSGKGLGEEVRKILVRLDIRHNNNLVVLRYLADEQVTALYMFELALIL